MKNYTGRISIRASPETHRLLAETAETLGVDLSALISLLITESMPPYVAKANEIKRRMAEANGKK